MTGIIAIVGRPNVGKSRLFNRLSESEKAIVHDYAGVTRDRQYARSDWFGKDYVLVDTGGFVPKSEEILLEQMRVQAQIAIDEADVIIFLMDAREGLVQGDEDIAAMLRMTTKPVFYAINKVDAWEKRDEMMIDFYALGVDIYPVSAEHGNGLDAMMDDLAEKLPETVAEEEDDDVIRIAVVGKPNSGKSTLLNAMIGEERLLTSEIPGTTRDSIDLPFEKDGQKYLLIDTAGLRRKSRVKWALEYSAVVQAIRSLDKADVALFLVDANEGVSDQDKKIASLMLGRGCACVFLVNKWDLVEKDNSTTGAWVRDIHNEMAFMRHFPILFISALTKQRVHRVLQEVNKVYEAHSKRIPTAQVNKWLAMVLAKHSPPTHKNRSIRFYYATQVASKPPTFAFIVNHSDSIAPSYRRFLENQLRDSFGFFGTPLKTLIRGRKKKDADWNT